MIRLNTSSLLAGAALLALASTPSLAGDMSSSAVSPGMNAATQGTPAARSTAERTGLNNETPTPDSVDAKAAANADANAASTSTSTGTNANITTSPVGGETRASTSSNVQMGNADQAAAADATRLGDTSTNYNRRNRASDFAREQQITDDLNAQAAARAKAS